MPDTTGSVDLNAPARTPEEEEAIRSLQNGEKPEEASEQASGAQQVLHTFLVVVDTKGNPQPIPFSHPQFQPLVESTPDLVYSAAATMMKDLAAMESAQATAEMMTAQAQALQQQMQDQMLQQQIARSGGLRK